MVNTRCDFCHRGCCVLTIHQHSETCSLSWWWKCVQAKGCKDWLFSRWCQSFQVFMPFFMLCFMAGSPLPFSSATTPELTGILCDSQHLSVEQSEVHGVHENAYVLSLNRYYSSSSEDLTATAATVDKPGTRSVLNPIVLLLCHE